jgi:hypothetical protein
VIPAYNREEFVGACIESALAQDYPAFEVIVVDDGSTDDTPSVCQKYSGRIRYVRKKNGGAASALNAGIRMMKGSWFKWLSSDDMLEPGCLRSLITTGEATGAGVVYGDYFEINGSGSLLRERRQKSFVSRTEFVVELWRHLVGSASAAVIRRECFERVGTFDERLRYAEDYDWWLRAALVHQVEFCHTPSFVARYRVHLGQATEEKRGRGAIISRRIKSNVRTLLRAQTEKNPALNDYYIEVTKSLRRSYGGIGRLGVRLRRAPKASAALYWACRIAPTWTSRIYWATYPPIGPAE